MSDETDTGLNPDNKICRLCLMAAILFAFGKEALMFI
jgi:hypothetical protein